MISLSSSPFKIFRLFYKEKMSFSFDMLVCLLIIYFLMFL